jgi:CRISPR-associated endonuclease Csn1
MRKTLGIDLGTNSIGLSVRDEDNGINIQDQLSFFTSTIFKSGVGKGKSGEISYTAKRREKRSSRRLYQARKYRIWNTLKLLIEYDFCPLSKDELERWSKYDKKRGLKRQYPIDAKKFEQWVRLDFDSDGIVDYKNPYELRYELVNKQFDFTSEIDRFKLGRALYHIAQRRGFKSSKGETIKEQEKKETVNDSEVEIDVITELKKSEKNKSKILNDYMHENNLPTVGCAFALLGRSGVRIHNSEFQAVRSQYQEEIKKIFEFQNGLNIQSEFYKKIISEKKNEGTIFYKRPLRSQKGLIGKCTLEPNKFRCPISHPDFEEFRAWCLINNIKYRANKDDDWVSLPIEKKLKLFQDKFLRTTANFKFEEIRSWLIKELRFELSYKNKTINYKENTNVSGCPISGRFKKLLGEDWKNVTLHAIRRNPSNGREYETKYDYNDLWHICFSFDEAENIKEFTEKELQFNDNQTQQLIRIWGAIPQGYSTLSLKAIHNINRFLRKGLIYTNAVLLAKLPEILKEMWEKDKDEIVEKIHILISENRHDKQLLNIANILISNYKSLEDKQQFAFKNTEYQLDNDDLNDVNKATITTIGEISWSKKTKEEQIQLLNSVTDLYQRFFASSKRDYFTLPKLADSLANYLHHKYSTLTEKDLNKIYHPSLIEFYTPSQDGLLGSPVIGALKNPMAMRVLHILRRQINSLLRKGIIDEETRIVVETAKELNDANTRWAIEAYQRTREEENKEFEKAIKEYFPNRIISENDIDKVRLLLDQYDILKGEKKVITSGEQKNNRDESKTAKRSESFKKDVMKYRLWLEQGCCCIYTGRPINITSLFDDNSIDFEHTIPKSISFDNSLSNLTICDAHYNRAIKRNQYPTQLANYDKDAIIDSKKYTAILPRIQPWIEKVETLKDNIEFWKGQSRYAQDKGRKDYCIRQRHLWQMELDYWQKKVNAFTMNEVTIGFRNNQLNDTRIITKFAYHYLRSLFSKVEVQNGKYTSDFRKMLGVQSIEEKKSRDKHSHHAIDATVLTLIPTAAKRDRMIELFYRIQDEKHLGHDVSLIESQLNQERKECGFGDVSKLSEFIEENILVNHVSKDQTLTPAKRCMRTGGQIIPLKDVSGNIIYKKNEDDTFKLDKFGHKIPKSKMWIQGDCIRGQLHGETFYGAITQAQKDENGKILRDENGKILIGEPKYVIRKELKFKKNDADTGFKTWKDIEKAIVDKNLFANMKSQFTEGTLFKDAVEQGIYMLDKKGNRVNKIRHIRCDADIKKPIIIKQQTYLSSKTYKQNYYATNGENIYFAIYWDGMISSNRTFDYRSLMDLAKMEKNVNIQSVKDYFEPTKLVGRSSKMKSVPIYAVLQNGTRVIVFNKEELNQKDLSIDDYKQYLSELDILNLLKRLYVVQRIFPNDGRLQLKYHLESRDDKKLNNDFPNSIYGEKGKNGFSEIHVSAPYPKLLLSPSKYDFIIEGKDFYIDSNEIIFI